MVSFDSNATSSQGQIDKTEKLFILAQEALAVGLIDLACRFMALGMLTLPIDFRAEMLKKIRNKN